MCSEVKSSSLFKYHIDSIDLTVCNGSLLNPKRNQNVLVIPNRQSYLTKNGYLEFEFESGIYCVDPKRGSIFEEIVVVITGHIFAHVTLVQHWNTTGCSCTKNSIEYSNFIKIRAKYHEICSSKFISL